MRTWKEGMAGKTSGLKVSLCRLYKYIYIYVYLIGLICNVRFSHRFFMLII